MGFRYTRIGFRYRGKFFRYNKE